MSDKTVIIDRDLYVKGNIHADKDIHAYHGSGLDANLMEGYKPGLGAWMIGFIIMWPVIVCSAFWMLVK